MCLHMWAPMYSMCIHTCSVYVTRSGRDQRILVALPLSPLTVLSGPLPFHVCCFWRQKSKGRAVEMLTHRAAAYSERKLHG